MSATIPAPTLLASLLWRGDTLRRNVALMIAGSLLLTFSAKAQIPFWPVPVTLQSLVVLMLGMAYGSRLGAATVLAYLAEGLVGLPVFAGAVAGPAYMAGPTGGYLVGFLVAVVLIGRLAERGWDRSLPWATAAMTIGHCLLFIPGIAWLAVLLGPEKAVAVGLTPFIFATIAKTLLGAAGVASVWAMVGKRSGA